MEQFWDIVSAWTATFFYSISSLSIGAIGNLLAITMVGLIWWSIYRMQKLYPDFNFIDLFINKKTKQIEDSRFRSNAAFMLTCWGFVYAMLHITGGVEAAALITGFAGVWVWDRNKSRAASITNDLNMNPITKDKVKDKPIVNEEIG